MYIFTVSWPFDPVWLWPSVGIGLIICVLLVLTVRSIERRDTMRRCFKLLHSQSLDSLQHQLAFILANAQSYGCSTDLHSQADTGTLYSTSNPVCLYLSELGLTQVRVCFAQPTQTITVSPASRCFVTAYLGQTLISESVSPVVTQWLLEYHQDAFLTTATS